MRIPAKYGLTFGFSGLIIVLAAFIIISSSLTSKAMLSRHAHTIMMNIASYTIDKSQSHLEPARKAARLTLGLSRHDIVSSRDTNSMVAYFYEQLYLYPQFSGIYFGAANGEFYMASRYNKLEQGGFYTKIIRKMNGKRQVEQIFKSPEGHLIRRQFDPSDDYDPRQRPWFKQAKEQDRLIWTSPYIFFTTQKPGITTANPVYDNLGNFLGVIGVDIEIDKLSTFISKLNVSEHGRAFILTKNGDLIAYPDLDKIKQSAKDNKVRLSQISELDDPVAREAFLSLHLPENELGLEKPVSTSFDINGERYIAMFAPFTDTEWPWLIGIYMPEDDYIGPIKQNGMLNVFIALLAIIFAVFFGLIVARKLNTAREMAEIADKAKSQFLARMSHEIRTPMNAILGAGELLAETDLNEEQRRYVSIYHSAGDHLRDLVSSVLDISKIEEGKFKLNTVPFNLHTVVENTCEVFSLDAADKGLELDCIIETDTPEHLTGDPTALKQVMVNLLSNAIKFTSSGSVSMELKAIANDASHEQQEMATIELKVTDTGIGISPAEQTRIFEQFIQADGSTSRMHGGTGLGLAISRHLARLMDGDLQVSSIHGSGSIFTCTVRLPVASEEDMDNPTLKPTTIFEQEDGRNRRILLVEDDERNRLLFSMFLKGTPYGLDTAEDGETALAKHKATPYDLILMDIEMPGMDGFETTEAIRAHEAEQQRNNTPIIAVTAHAVTEAETRCKRSGCTDYLAKPVTKAGLRQKVNEYLGTTHVQDPAKQ